MPQVYPDLPSQLWPVKRESVWDGLHVEATPTGREFRSLSSTYPRRRYELKYGALSRVEAERLIEFYDAMGSGFGTFLFRDRDDDRVTLQEVAVTNGTTTTWQLGRAPNNVPKNLLSNSGATLLSPWFGAGVSLTSTLPSPDVFDAALIAESAANTAHYVSQGNMPVTPGQEYTFALKLLPAGRQRVRLHVFDSDTLTSQGYADVHLTAGTATLSGSAVDGGVVSVGGAATGFVTVTLGAAVVNARARIQLLDDSGAASYLGDGVSGVHACDAEFYRGRFIGASSQRMVGGAVAQFLAPIFDLAGSPSIYLADSTGLALQTSGYTINATGSVVFSSAPAGGKRLLWSGGFYHRARFEDGGDTEQFARTLYRSGTVRIITVKP